MRAGEHSGELAAVMSSLADYLERRQATRQSAGLALLYPAIVAAVALCIVVGLLTYVVPQVVEVYAQSRQTLPLLTRAAALGERSAARQALLHRDHRCPARGGFARGLPRPGDEEKVACKGCCACR